MALCMDYELAFFLGKVITVTARPANNPGLVTSLDKLRAVFKDQLENYPNLEAPDCRDSLDLPESTSSTAATLSGEYQNTCICGCHSAR